MFLDTIMSCGKAGELYLWAGLSASGKENDLRTALYLALTRYVNSGYVADGQGCILNTGQRRKSISNNG